MKSRKNEKDIYVGILTTYVDDELTRADYEEYCEINEIDAGGEDAFDEWKHDEAEQTWEDDMENLAYILNEDEFAIVGSVGRWDGRRTIQAERMTGLQRAIKRCISRDHMDIEVRLNTETGAVEYRGHHHDGIDCFEIYRLSPLGIKWWNARESKGEKILPNAHWFKRIDRKEIWG
jgi:hypothetical protein